jgi:hypothetical protein
VKYSGSPFAISVGSYVKNLRDRLTHAYQLATETSRNAQVRQKEGYDIKVRGAVGFIREQEISSV